jgi:hypothetical protein
VSLNERSSHAPSGLLYPQVSLPSCSLHSLKVISQSAQQILSRVDPTEVRMTATLSFKVLQTSLHRKPKHGGLKGYLTIIDTEFM